MPVLRYVDLASAGDQGAPSDPWLSTLVIGAIALLGTLTALYLIARGGRGRGGDRDG